MSDSLLIRDQNIKGRRVELEPAILLGDYSVDRIGTVCSNNKENMKFLNRNFRTTTSVRFDLNKGHPGDKARDMTIFLNEKRNLLSIQRWILSNKAILYDQKSGSNLRIFPDFVFRRGTLSHLLDTTTSPDLDWKLHVTKYRGTIYMARITSEDEILSCSFQTAMQINTQHYGSRFEEYMTGGCGAVDANEDYYCVVDTSLGTHRLLIHGEIDGVDRDMYTGRFPSTMDALIELKTTKDLNLPNALQNFRYYKKPMKWWQQSAVFGIREIVVGFKNYNGTVCKTEVVKVKDLQNYKEKNQFDTNKMLSFTVRLFDWMKKVVTEESQTMYEIRYIPGTGKVTCRIVRESCFLSPNFRETLFPK